MDLLNKIPKKDKNLTWRIIDGEAVIMPLEDQPKEVEKSKIYNFYLKTKGGTVPLSGKSMYPALKEGWRVKVVSEDASNIKVRDIIVFGKEGLTCHRIIGKIKFFGRYYFIQKGDNSSVGGIVKGDDLIGKVAEAFDEEGKNINISECLKADNKNMNIFAYFYFIAYLLKRFIWRDSTNAITRFARRLYWKFI
ncbi:MAG: hypothetical protein A2047_00480 [Omnitrophica bacterium GWA2_41_15]|nr:MAG: hypothetical protein A2047_00480 [Omnitrophica bacterium GWA2_41_15]HAZ11000.1 hypothetical protein [Candidatus Omnitrophota bacterium]